MYKDIEETFAGDVENVWVGVNRFFCRLIPLIDMVQGVVMTVDLEKVVKASKGFVAVAKEGPIVLISRRKLTDRESLLMMLLSGWVGGRLGVLDRVWLSKEELRVWLGKNEKIVGTRLGELCREGKVVRTEDGGGFRLSTLGVKWLIDEALPQIRSKV